MNNKSLSDLFYILLEYLISKSKFLSSIYIKLYKYQTKNEIILGDIHQTDKVLLIGCGSIPASAILLLNFSNCKITAIDNDKIAIENAVKLLIKYGMYKSINVIFEKGEDIDINNFDVIIISKGISDKEEILNNMACSINYNTKIIVRVNITKEKEKIIDTMNKLNFYYNGYSTNFSGNSNSILFTKKYN